VSDEHHMSGVDSYSMNAVISVPINGYDTRPRHAPHVKRSSSGHHRGDSAGSKLGHSYDSPCFAHFSQGVSRDRRGGLAGSAVHAARHRVQAQGKQAGGFWGWCNLRLVQLA
jgi:hypothetical protein